MERILIIGCGDIALRVATLLGSRYQLYGLVRNPAYLEKLRAANILPLLGDLDDRHSLRKLAGLADTVLHFAPPHTAVQISGTTPSARIRDLIDYRTRNLIAALSHERLPKRLIYISTSGVYGDCMGEIVNETRSVNPVNSRAQLRVDAENQIRRWTKRSGINASILRVPGIYAADRLPAERLKKGTPAITSAEDGYTNHIHADDLAIAIVAALRHAKPGRIYHTVDDSNMKMGEYFDAVADALYLPHPPRVSRAEAQKVLSPMLLSFMNESRRLSNTRMKQELKLVMRYPTVAHTLDAMSAGEIKPNGSAESTRPVYVSPHRMQLSLPLS